MVDKKVNRPSAELAKLNRDRLRILLAHGYKGIKVDGSWGPYQLKLWDKYTSTNEDFKRALLHNDMQVKYYKALNEGSDAKISLWDDYPQYRLPFILDKAVTLKGVNPRYRGATFSTNMLDSLYKDVNYDKKDFDTALALFGNETMFGKGRMRFKNYDVLPYLTKDNSTSNWQGTTETEALSNWQLLMGNVGLNSLYDNIDKILGHFNSKQAKDSPELSIPTQPLTKLDSITLLKGIDLLSQQNSYMKEHPLTESPIKNLVDLYNKNPKLLNPGAPNYVTLIEKTKQELNLEPAIIEWKRKNFKSDGGSLKSPLDWNELSMKEKAAYIRMGVANGYKDIDSIKEVYNEFKCGGYLYGKGGKKQNDTSVPPATRKAIDFFMSKGLTDYLAAGLVGNLIRESQLNPNAVNKSSGAYGIAQWLGSRKDALFNKYGQHPTLDLLLDFVWRELNSTHKSGLKNLKLSNDPYEAARNAFGYYEFSVGPEGAIREMNKYKLDGQASMDEGIRNAHNVMMNISRDYRINQKYPELNPSIIQYKDISLPNDGIPQFKYNGLTDYDKSFIVDDETLNKIMNPLSNNTTLGTNIPFQQAVLGENVLPEITVTPEEEKHYYIKPNPQLLLALINSMMVPYELPEIPRPVTATERLAQLNLDKNSLLLQDLENSILRASRFGTPLDEVKLARDVKDLQFYRNMAADGGNIFLIGGSKGRLAITNLSPWDEMAALLPIAYTLGKLLDPTGITGYSDTKEAWKEFKNEPALNTGYNAVMETLGSFPVIGGKGKILKTIQGLVTGQGVLNDWNHAKEMQNAYNKELVVDYWDNTVKPREEAYKHNEQIKKKMSYTEVNHLPAFSLAPKGTKVGDILPNYNINNALIEKYKNKHASGGPLEENTDTIYVDGYPLVYSDSEGLTGWFNNNPDVAGMAIGAGLNGIEGRRRVVLNPNLKDKDARNSVYKNESYRHYFDTHSPKLPNLTNLQRDAYIGTPYEGLDRKIQETEVARYLSGDDSHHLTKKQIAELDNYAFVYPGRTLPEVVVTAPRKHSFGGPLVEVANKYGKGGNMDEEDNEEYLGTTATGTSMFPYEYAVATAPRKYFVKYDEEGNPIYTEDYALSQEAITNSLPEDPEVARRKQALIDIKNRPAGELTGTAKAMATMAELGIGSALAPLAAAPLIEGIAPALQGAWNAASPYVTPYIQGALKFGLSPVSSIAEGISNYVPQIASQASKAIPYLQAAEKTGWGLSGAIGLYNNAKDLVNGDKHWANALAEGALEGMMMTELSPVVKEGYNLAKQGYNIADASAMALGNNPIVKRALEAAALTDDINPLPMIRRYLNQELGYNALMKGEMPKDTKHLGNTLKYIFTGKGDSKNAYFAPEGYGFERANDDKTGYLRALLYGEEPGTDLIKLGTAADIPVGEHLQTLLDRGYKPELIRVYSTNMPGRGKYLSPNLEELNLHIANMDYISRAADSSLPTTNGNFDAAGHRIFNVGKGLDESQMELDFTDFNTTAYGKKWIGHNINPFLNFGLKVMDRATTPIIVRTKWGSRFPSQLSQTMTEPSEILDSKDWQSFKDMINSDMSAWENLLFMNNNINTSLLKKYTGYELPYNLTKKSWFRR